MLQGRNTAGTVEKLLVRTSIAPAGYGGSGALPVVACNLARLLVPGKRDPKFRRN
jgi:hypothetical protein